MTTRLQLPVEYLLHGLAVLSETSQLRSVTSTNAISIHQVLCFPDASHTLLCVRCSAEFESGLARNTDAGLNSAGPRHDCATAHQHQNLRVHGARGRL